jgi:tetratricopeptide (TPR) repeat protein
MESRMKIALRIAVILLALAGSAWAIHKWSYQPYACNAAMTEITGATRAGDHLRSDYSKFQRAQRNIERLQQLERQCRSDVRLYILLAANESAAGRPEDAIEAYHKALTIDRRSEIYYGLAEQLVQLGRTDEAVEVFLTAARFNPNAMDWVPSPEIHRRVTERLQKPR